MAISVIIYTNCLFWVYIHFKANFLKLQNQNLYSVLKNEVYWKLFLVAFVLLLTGLQKSYTAANIDSLQSILSNTNDTTILVETLIQISDEYVLYDVDNAIKYAKESYELASKFDDNELVIRSGFTTIKSLMPKGAFDEALDLTKELVSLSREINNKRFESDAHAFAAAIYRRKGNSEMTLKSYDRCRILSDEIGYDLGLAKAQTGYGEYKEREGLYLESFENYNRALEITRSEKSRNRDLEILVLKKIAFTHRYLGDYDKALEQFIEVLTYYESLGDIVRVADLHNNIASVYWDIESDEKAIEYWNLAIDLAKKTNNKDALANAYQGINIYYRFNGKFDIAEEYCLLDLKLRNEMGDIRGLSYSFKNIGRNYQAKGDLVSAKSYLLKGLENAQQLGQQLKIAWMNQQVGRLLNDMNKPLEAIEYILKSAELSKSINDIKGEGASYEDLAQSYALSGQMDKAFESQKKFTDLKTKLLNDKINEETVKMQTIYETQKRDDEIASLEKETLLQNELLTQSELVRNLSLGGVVLLIGFASMLFYNSKQKQKSNNLLSLKNEEIAEQNMVIQESLEQKEVLLKEIHHRVKNNLQIISSLLNLQSKKIKDNNVLASINEGRNRVEAMSLIHQNLYQNEEVASINMQNYL
tara:strand:- start:1077 stop:3008 length:1932 start_codon:yes stop_codon:yes gene_type:complete